jgi:translocator assembly and maintenance protein 41
VRNRKLRIDDRWWFERWNKTSLLPSSIGDRRLSDNIVKKIVLCVCVVLVSYHNTMPLRLTQYTMHHCSMNMRLMSSLRINRGLCWIKSPLHKKSSERGHRNLRHLTAAAGEITAQIASNEELVSIADQFSPGIDYAFGYGSGVFLQKSRDVKTSPGMIDIILAVDDPRAWHGRNLQRHSSHYSLMARLGGARYVTWLQTNFGARLYFHPFVKMNIPEIRPSNEYANQTKISKPTNIQRQVKYGVVSSDDLIQDLVSWDYLYLAGRMHKPIVSVDVTSNSGSSNEEQAVSMKAKNRADEIDDAQRTNLLSAVSASLLLHSTFNSRQHPSSLHSIPTKILYNTIAGLSYTGDFRMETGAEDPNKIDKLVETPGMLERWDEKYSDSLGNLQGLGLLSVVNDTQSTRLEVSLTDTAVRKHLAQNLPLRLRSHADLIVGSDDGGLILRQELAKIVSPAAKSQSMKGLFTAGVVRSWRYALAKLAKGGLRKR